jgi:TonB family protein
MEAMQKYLRDNVHYPQSAIDRNVQGRVMVAFVVTRTGDISQVSVVKGLDPELDSEAVRAVQAMPKWEPAALKGQKVNVYYKVPIVFKLMGDSLHKTLAQNTMPQFKGGNNALLNYLRDNVRYPEEAIERKIQGSIIVEFVIDEKGNVSDVKSLRGLEGGCTEEALRVIENTSGKWEPGTKDGKPVRTSIKIPVSFRLQ